MITLSDTIRKPAQTPCQTPAKPGPKPLLAGPDPLRRQPLTSPRRRKPPRGRSSAAPLPATPRLASAVNRRHPGPWTIRPQRRPSADPGNGAEASDRDGSGSDAAGAPSFAPPEFAGAAAAGTSATLGHIGSFSRAAHSGGRITPAPRKTSGTTSPREALPPGAPGLAPQAARLRSALARHPTRSAVLTKAPGTAESR